MAMNNQSTINPPVPVTILKLRVKGCQGRALAQLGGSWHPTFAPGRLQNLRFLIQIICWAPWILQVQSTGHPSIFLRALVACCLHDALHCMS